MLLRQCIAIAVLAVCAGASAGAAPGGGGTGPDSDVKVFRFRLQKGQYILVGNETGVAGKSKWDQGADPVKTRRISSDTTASTWAAEFRIQPASGDAGEKIWKWEALWSSSDPDGSMHTRAIDMGQVAAPVDKEVEPLPIEKVDVSKEMGFDGLQVYKFPYAKVEGETWYLVLAIANKADLFHKAAVKKRTSILLWIGPPLDNETRVFSFPLQKGQYIFLGQETGIKGKVERDRGIDPILRERLSPDAMASTWVLQVRVRPISGEKGGRGWKWEVACLSNEPSGRVSERHIYAFPDTIPPRDKKVKLLPIEKVDVSKETGVDGFRVYRFPYAKVEGETWYLVLAIGNKSPLFSKTIAIAKKYLLDLNWDRWTLIGECRK